MKMKMFVAVLLMVVLSAGCGKKNNEIQESSRKTEAGVGTEQVTERELETGTDGTEDGQATEKTETGSKQGTGQETGTEPKPDGEPESESPANYQRESESGKVKFDCRIETPDSYTGDNVHKYLVSGEYYGDNNRILSRYVEGKEVAEQFSTEAHDGIPGTDSFNMADGAVVNLGGSGFGFSSRNSNYYYNARAMDSEYQEEYGKGKVNFATAEEAIEAVKQELAETGFSEFEFQLVAYPANHEIMKKIEAEIYTSEEDQSQKKDTWTQEDDIYVVYGFQAQDNIPIFHRWMTIFRVMAYDNVNNAPISAVYSGRGIESLIVQPIYYLEDTGEALTLKEFEEIAGIVEVKFENILNESTYVVNRAKLFQMVRLNENQEYAAEPIWYFEVTEDGGKKSVTLIDAVTGKEIVLK